MDRLYNIIGGGKAEASPVAELQIADALRAAGLSD